MLLDKIELVNIMAQFGFFLILTFVHASRVDQRMNLLLKYSIIASLAVIWMSQTIPESQPSDSLNLDMPIGQKRIENRHTFGTTIGRITGTEDVESLGCDGLTVLRTEEFETNFSVGYVYERTVVKGEGTSTVFAVGGNYTNVVERLFSSAPNLNESNVFGFSLGGTAEWNKPMVGFKVGFQAGTLFYYYNRDYMKFGSAGVSGEVEKIHFVPALALRVGDLNNFYGIASIGDDLQNGIYRYLYRGVVGYNFSRNYNRDFRLEAGLTDRLQLSLEADLSITDNWSLRPAVYLLNAPLYSIGASYRPD